VTTTPKSSESTASRHQLIVQFLADIMRATGTPDDQEAFQRSLQAYVDSLRPWLEPQDGPATPRALFTLIEKCAFDDSAETVTVVLSPEAEALFRAWQRRHKIASTSGLHTAHAWSN
jgi:uncharacterized protein (DUF2267 family)